MEKIEKNLQLLPGTIDFWNQEVKKLEQRDEIFRAADFDYTLFSRDEQLDKEEILRNNRWDSGPAMCLEAWKLQDIIHTYYGWYSMPTEILSQLNSEKDIIITAGMREFQMWKIRTLPQLNWFKTIVTKDWIQKIPELIRYILFELRYIPKEIIVYEDRPQYFVEYRELIEQSLWTKLTIMKVEMDGNDGYKSIEKI